MSTLITRTDNVVAGKTVDETNKFLLELRDEGGLKLMDNTDILKSHLGRKGLHLSDRGTGKLITNFVNFIKQMRAR